MAKQSGRQSIEEKLSRLKELEEGARSENAALEIRQALLGRSSTLAERALMSPLQACASS